MVVFIMYPRTPYSNYYWNAPTVATGPKSLHPEPQVVREGR